MQTTKVKEQLGYSCSCHCLTAVLLLLLLQRKYSQNTLRFQWVGHRLQSASPHSYTQPKFQQNSGELYPSERPNDAICSTTALTCHLTCLT